MAEKIWTKDFPVCCSILVTMVHHTGWHWQCLRVQKEVVRIQEIGSYVKQPSAHIHTPPKADNQQHSGLLFILETWSGLAGGLYIVARILQTWRGFCSYYTFAVLAVDFGHTLAVELPYKWYSSRRQHCTEHNHGHSQQEIPAHIQKWNQ